MVLLGIVTGEGGFSLIPNFIDVTSVIITIGGSLAGVTGANKIPDVINGVKGILLTIK